MLKTAHVVLAFFGKLRFIFLDNNNFYINYFQAVRYLTLLTFRHQFDFDSIFPATQRSIDAQVFFVADSYQII